MYHNQVVEESSPLVQDTQEGRVASAVSKARDEEKIKTSADYYFDSYSHHSIHEEMLKDQVRTSGYRAAIEKNKNFIRGQVVLDVGCGTGILSLFAAKAGAKAVYAVECSGIADQAEEIVRLNGYADVIHIIKGKLEDVVLPVDQVHVIISEWMGYFLLYESMLNTVLYARDKWLAPGGIILPDQAYMYIAGIEDAEYKQEKIGFWDNVYGFNFSPIKRLAMLEPLVEAVDPRQVNTTHGRFLEFNLHTVKLEDLAFDASFTIQATQDDNVHALVAWFDCTFGEPPRQQLMSTSPFGTITHWKQTVFYLDKTLQVKQGEEIKGTISAKPNKGNHRDLDIRLKLAFEGGNAAQCNQDYRLR